MILNRHNKKGYKDKIIFIYNMADEAKKLTVKDLEDKYFDLVWYARKPPKTETEYWDNIPEDIIAVCEREIKETEDKYPDEVARLRCPFQGDWEHGFNSGMLAAMRLLRPNIVINKSKMKEFPSLDT